MKLREMSVEERRVCNREAKRQSRLRGRLLVNPEQHVFEPDPGFKNIASFKILHRIERSVRPRHPDLVPALAGALLSVQTPSSII